MFSHFGCWCMSTGVYMSEALMICHSVGIALAGELAAETIFAAELVQ